MTRLRNAAALTCTLLCFGWGVMAGLLFVDVEPDLANGEEW